MKKVSIIIPAYNIENYIERSLNSVLKQTYSNLEIIVVDDGSIDNTAQVIKALAEQDSRIRVIHKENGGVTSARIAGVELASGDYIGFVDGDDFIEPDMYECLINHLEQSNADIAHCGYRMVFPTGRIDYYYNTGKTVIQNNQSGLIDLMKGEFIEPGLVNKLFKRSLFKSIIENEIMDLSIKNNEDLLLNYYLFKNSEKSIYVDFCPYHYILRKNSAATSKISENKIKDPILVSNIIINDCKDNIDLTRILNVKLVRQYVNIISLDLIDNCEFIKEYKVIARRELKHLLPLLLKEKSASKKVILMCFIALLCPKGYKSIHKLYSKYTGNDKKYSIE